MPSTTEKQRKFMGAELARKRAGKKTKTGMSEKQLGDFASKPLSKSINSFIINKMKKEVHAPDMSTNQGVFKSDAIDKGYTKYPKWNEKRKVSEGQLDKWAQSVKVTDARPIAIDKKGKIVKKGDKGKAIGAAIGTYLGDKAEDALLRTKVAKKIKAFLGKQYTKSLK